MESVDVAIRQATANDVPLILSSWLQTGADSPYGRMLGRRVWFAGHEKLLRERVLPRAGALVAHLPDEPDVVLAWVCFEGPALHYVYCKKRWRKLGVVQRLFSELPEIMVATHRADKTNVYPFNPYPLFFGVEAWPLSPSVSFSSRLQTPEQTPEALTPQAPPSL